MKFYIAAALDNAEYADSVAAALTAAGHEQTFNWRDGLETDIEKITGDYLRERAELERCGVEGADLIAGILPGGRGTHMELGMALALNKRIVLWGAEISLYRYPCSFYQLMPDYIEGTIDKFISSILERGRQIDMGEM